MEFKITGSVIHAYVVCPRKSWLMTRQISGDQDNELLEIGRFISEKTYKRDNKEINLGDSKIDFIRKKDNILIISETKKSSKMIDATEAQLLFYLFSYKDNFRKAYGEIRIPKEKKVIPIELAEEKENYVKCLINEIEELINTEKPPDKKRIKACASCSYLEFCWS
ncbi:MAG: CRISPR-associated protein Cas4 [Desulforegulaceae bacterium]|nr:CRISPR-associated protein Cas4 [Desulforegulaceae bacterium]